ncbi:MAG TPA: toprim domain-containing protein [Nitrososphaerales archaeon]
MMIANTISKRKSEFGRIMFRKNFDKVIAESLAIYVKKLNDENSNGALVVVEGLRDYRSLRSIGFLGNIFMFCNKNNLLRLVEESKKYRKVILLFDLDREGRSLTNRTITMLEAIRIPVDLFFRRELISTTRGKVRHVEELSRFKEYLEPLLD